MTIKHLAIIGGMGPAAGARFFSVLTGLTPATTDADHLDVTFLSWPSVIEDRTRFLLGESEQNPAYSICNMMDIAESMAADALCIPCVTCHSRRIWQEIETHRTKNNHRYELLSLKDVLAGWCVKNLTPGDSVGVLATNGSVRCGVFSELLDECVFDVIFPDERTQSECVHQAIYHPAWGIKSVNMDLTRVREALFKAMDRFIEQGVSAIVLGCTELPLVVGVRSYKNVAIVDPALELAKKIVGLRERNVA